MPFRRIEAVCVVVWTLIVLILFDWDFVSAGGPAAAMSPGVLQSEILSHGIVWLVVLGMLHLGFKAMRRQDVRRAVAEESLRRSEERYRSLFEHMSSGAAVHEMIFDVQGRPVDYRFLAVNACFEEMTGLRAEDIIGRTVREVIPTIEDAWIERYGRVTRTGVSERFENHAGSLQRTFDVVAFQVGEGRFACAFSDITWRKEKDRALLESEERLAAIVTSMDDLVFVLDEAGRFEKFAQGRKRSGLFAMPEQFEGRLYRDVLPPELADRFDAVLIQLQETGRSQSFEYSIDVAGAETWWSARASPLRNRHGRMCGTVVVTRDVTMQRVARENLKVRNRYLEGLAKISAHLLRSEDDAGTMDRIAAEVAAMADFEMAAIVTRLPAADRLRVDGVCGVEIGDRSPPGLRIDNGLSGRVIRDGVSVVLTNASVIDQTIFEEYRSVGLKVFAGVPIAFGEQVMGVLWIGSLSEKPVDGLLLGLLRGVANHLVGHLDRLRTEDERRLNESELRSIYDSAPVIMALLDDAGAVIRSNRAAEEFVGISRVPGRKVGAGDLLGCLGSLYDPKGCGHGPECGNCAIRNAVIDTVRTGTAHRQIEVHKSVLRGGQAGEVDLLVSTAALSLGGERRALLVMEDVTKARKTEAYVREQAALLDVTHDAIYVEDGEGHITYWNKGAELMYQIARHEALGRRLDEFVSTPVPQSGTGGADGTAWTGEVEQTVPGGRAIVVQSRRTRVESGAERFRSTLVVNTDVTENRRLSRHLLRSQRLESIGTLASGIAHDLNNVLAPIMMSLGILRSRCDASGEDMLDAMESCVRRGADIVRQVLLFARGVDGQRIVLQPKHVLDEIARIVRGTFPRSIEVGIEAGREPWRFTGDPTQIQQVLLNICVNARDAMPSGGELKIGIRNVVLRAEDPRIHPFAEPGRYTVFVISDTGVGIAAEHLERIFDPFFTTKPLGQGTGLGLATSLGIVEKHGGFIQVSAASGRGSVFSVYLPSCEAVEMPVERTPEAAPRGSGELILVVDDEPAVRKLVACMLQSAGYRVALACDGREALEHIAAEREHISLVLTDLMMPRLDGARFIRELRAALPHVAIVAMTGVGEERRVQEAMAAGVAHVLDKPFEVDDMLRLLGRVVTPKAA